MGAFGFTIPLTPLSPEATELDHDAYEQLAESVRELLEAWIEERLQSAVEEEFLELADDVWSDVCGFPGCDCFSGEGLHLPFIFTDHAPNVSTAVEHWFCLAASALGSELSQHLRASGFETSLEEVTDSAEGTVLVPTDEDILVVDLEGEEDSAYATSEEAPEFDELPGEVRQQAQAARKSGRCHCSICSARRE